MLRRLLDSLTKNRRQPAATVAFDGNELDRLLDRIRHGPEQDRTAGLEVLLQRARESGTPDAWNAVALGMRAAERFDDAIQLFEDLVKQDPSAGAYRLSLATTYAQTNQAELCRHHLQELIDHGATEEIRTVARQQLDNFNRATGRSDEDQELRARQLVALRERVAGSPGAEDFARLGRLLLRMDLIARGSGAFFDEAVTTLEEGARKFPSAVLIWELLATCYSRYDPNDRLPAVLREIEQVGPDSPVLEAFSDVTESDFAEHHDVMLRRARGLCEKASSDDLAIREVALHELAQLVHRFPTDSDYRSLYGFALVAHGRVDEAIRQAETLAKTAAQSHTVHFNLGQIFWFAGDSHRGQHHLNLALQYAGSEEERAAVRERIAALSSKPDE